MGCYWVILRYVLPAEYAGRRSGNTTDAFEVQEKYVEDVKSALQADAVIQKTAFSGEISFKVNVTQTSATGHLIT